MITSGSWRRIARRPRAKVRSMCGLTWVWPTPSTAYSTGSSTVMMLRLRSLSRAERGIERGGLARAGRAGDEHDAVRPREQPLEGGAVARGSCRAGRGRAAPRRCRAGASPPARRTASGWSRRARRSRGRRRASETRPSCGSRFSAMSSRAITLMRLTSSGASARRGSSISRSTPSMRKRTTRPALLGLDMDVGGVLLDRLEQERVDQADDRRIVALVEQIVHHRGAVGERGEIVMVGRGLRGLRGGVAVGLRQRRIEGGVAEHLEAEAGSGQPLHLDERGHRRARAMGADQAVAIAAQDHAMPPREAVGQRRRAGGQVRPLHRRHRCSVIVALTMPGSGRRSISIAARCRP